MYMTIGKLAGRIDMSALIEVARALRRILV
jgi:hypothetical protein